jgi:predicted AlkP superfamily pyrophosphatase or phosphodiesterase
VVLVVLDGLRPDAVNPTDHPNLTRLAAGGATAIGATTVAPSVTAAAMSSLLTGVDPSVHGVRSDRFHIPRTATKLSPMPKVLTEGHYPTAAYLAEVPLLFRGLATRIANQAGVIDARFIGATSTAIVRSARHAVTLQRRGLIIMHWPDADRAGHDFGWMSPEYMAASRAMDAALGNLAALLEVPRDPGTLLIALSDHGGGGATVNDHDSDHPLDRGIVLTIAGRNVANQIIERPSLLDVPPTILWALGSRIPANYAGRPLTTAFASVRDPQPSTTTTPTWVAA